MYPGQPEDLEWSSVDSILRKLRELVGVDFTEYRASTIRRRVCRRLAATQSADIENYVRTLDKDPDECRVLLRELTIKFSEFYRDPPLWEFLRNDLLPDLIQGKIASGNTGLRVWSAGCALGEEPFTAAMVIDRALGPDRERFDLQIVATDLDSHALEQAVCGEYSATVCCNLPNDYQAEYISAGRTRKVCERLRTDVRFVWDNLADPNPADSALEGLDLILCRNVLIYMTRPLQIRVLERLIRSLSPGGVLVLGTAEVIPQQFEPRFRELNREYRVFQLKP